MKNNRDRAIYGAAGGCGVSSGLGFLAVAVAHRSDLGILAAAGGAGLAVLALGASYVQWAVTK